MKTISAGLFIAARTGRTPAATTRTWPRCSATPKLLRCDVFQTGVLHAVHGPADA